MKKLLKIVLSLIVAIAVALTAFVYFISYHPKDVQPVAFVSPDDAPVLQPGQKLKLMSWNIQFMAGNENNDFFFSGGNDKWASQETINATLKEVARVIIDENPDIILLQEVDDGAVRTYHQDQLAELMKLLPASYSSHSSAFYWKTKFIPHPEIMGAMGMKLSTISKYKIDAATRYALSPITNQNIIVTQTSIKRSLHGVNLPIQGGGNLYGLNGHLSAFAQGSDTMSRQIAQVDQLLSDLEKQGNVGFIGGDFNLIPPGKAFSRLSEKTKGYYNPEGSEIKLLYDNYKVIPTLAEVDGPDYLKWAASTGTAGKVKSPQKTIDYFIFTDKINYGEHYVRSSDTLKISDHLPLVTYITVPEAL